MSMDGEVSKCLTTIVTRRDRPLRVRSCRSRQADVGRGRNDTAQRGSSRGLELYESNQLGDCSGSVRSPTASESRMPPPKH